jgi:hypothetical protein
MPNYQDAKIYAVECAETGLCYVGATCCELTNRFAGHKSKLKRGIVDTKCALVLGGGECTIRVLEAFPCTSKAELDERELHWINQMDCVNAIRKIYPPVPADSWKSRKRQELNAYRRAWRQAQRDLVKAHALIKVDAHELGAVLIH